MEELEKLLVEYIIAVWEAVCFLNYQFAKFKDQINIGPGYYVISVNGMCRSNVIIYQNETKFEIYCNDKTESHHITEILLKVAIITITSKDEADRDRHKVSFLLIRAT
jgi:hypothetical protein